VCGTKKMETGGPSGYGEEVSRKMSLSVGVCFLWLIYPLIALFAGYLMVCSVMRREGCCRERRVGELFVLCFIRRVGFSLPFLLFARLIWLK
jgi:hypothetical protein